MILTKNIVFQGFSYIGFKHWNFHQARQNIMHIKVSPRGEIKTLVSLIEEKMGRNGRSSNAQHKNMSNAI